MGAGAFVGPLISGLLAPYGFPVLCYVMTGIFVFNAIVGQLMWKDLKKVDGSETDKAAEDGESGSEESVSLCGDVVVVKLQAISAINAFGWMLSDGPETIFFAQHFGFGARDLAAFFCVITGVMCIFTCIVPSIIARFGDVKTCAWGCLGSAVVVSTLLFVGAWWEPYLYGGLGCGVFGMMTGIAGMNVLTKVCPESQRGRLMGLSASLGSFGAFVRPVVGGAMYVYNNYLPYAFTSGAFLIATALYLSLPEPPPEKVEPLLPIYKFKRAVRKVQAVRWIGGEVMFSSQQQLTRKESVMLTPKLNSTVGGAASPVKLYSQHLICRAQSSGLKPGRELSTMY